MTNKFNYSSQNSDCQRDLGLGQRQWAADVWGKSSDDPNKVRIAPFICSSGPPRPFSEEMVVSAGVWTSGWMSCLRLSDHIQQPSFIVFKLRMQAKLLCRLIQWNPAIFDRRTLFYLARRMPRECKTVNVSYLHYLCNAQILQRIVSIPERILNKRAKQKTHSYPRSW